MRVPVGQKLYLIRIKQGMTQEALSRLSGVPQANLSRIEQGRQDPTVSTLLKICTALVVRPAELFEDLLQAEPRFTRASVERMAKGVLHPELKLSAEENEIVGLLKNLLPHRGPGRIPEKRVYTAWHELKKRLDTGAIRLLSERVEEEEARQEARAQRDYAGLLANIKKLLGRE